MKICLPAAGGDIPAEHTQCSQSTDGTGWGTRNFTGNKTGARRQDHPTSNSITGCSSFAVTPLAPWEQLRSLVTKWPLLSTIIQPRMGPPSFRAPGGYTTQPKSHERCPSTHSPGPLWSGPRPAGCVSLWQETGEAYLDAGTSQRACWWALPRRSRSLGIVWAPHPQWAENSGPQLLTKHWPWPHADQLHQNLRPWTLGM